MKKELSRIFTEHIQSAEKLLRDDYIDLVEEMAIMIIDTYEAKRKVLICGNGGSAADSQHFAAELVCRFEKNRAALPAIALTTNTSTITATGNDFSFEDVFSRQVAAFAQEGDLLIGFTTSGNSPNVLKAVDEAKAMKVKTIGFTGQKGGKIRSKVDKCFCAPSDVTGRIQETHILVVHALCRLVEESLFGEKK